LLHTSYHPTGPTFPQTCNVHELKLAVVAMLANAVALATAIEI